MRKALMLALVAICAAVVAATALGKPAKAEHKGLAFDHAFVIMLENHGKASIFGDPNTPYISSLAAKYASAPNYYGVTHPSEPNYVALISGSNWGMNDDNPANTFDHSNIADELDARHLSWNGYMENLPSAGDVTDTQYPANAALYVKKHDPFALFTDIASSSARAKNIKPLTDLTGDLKSGEVGNFALIVPNQCHDMHGGVYTQVAADGSDGTPCPYGSTNDDTNDVALKQKADAFVKQWVETITTSKVWKTSRVAIFVVADEADYDGTTSTDGWADTSGCCDSPYLPAGTEFLGATGQPDGNTWGGGVYGGGKVGAAVITNSGRSSGFASSNSYNHYSLLATVEWNWGLPYLGNASDTRQVHPMTDFFTVKGSDSKKK
jgi:hypothetical protein